MAEIQALPIPFERVDDALADQGLLLKRETEDAETFLVASPEETAAKQEAKARSRFFVPVRYWSFQAKFELSSTDKWAIDRENDSYLFESYGLTDRKIMRRGYIFFRNKAFGVYMHMSNYVSERRNNYVPKGRVGWLSLARDFSVPPRKTRIFSRRFQRLMRCFWENSGPSRFLVSNSKTRS
ncbi:MAG: hypothetical protein LBR95_06125 [Azoarcus sp.]|jgi:hypothetical protein|nr:hypothetical protein [Azoarcus sp.]